MEEVVVEGGIVPKKKRFPQRLKRRLLKHVWLVRIGIVVSAVLGIYLVFLGFGFLFGRVGITNYTQIITNFIFAPVSKLNSVKGRVNLLILGKGGQGHEAADLTDTIIFGSVSLDNPKISLISLPRDIWVPAIRAKVNSAYYWGNQKQDGGGLILAKSTVEEITGQPIEYGLAVDFSGFIKMVDVIGGIEVEVERAFVDEKYPISGKENDLCDGDPEYNCRYESVRFEKGYQMMDGAMALKFVRSRNAQGEEGTDLARAARQQKVIIAVKKNVLTWRVLTSPKKILALWEVVRESVETDISPSTGAILARLALGARDKISTHVLSEDLLINPPISPRYDNQYVFIPANGDWTEVHDWVLQKLP